MRCCAPVLLATTSLFCGCSFAPPYAAPAVGVAAPQYLEADEWKVAEPRDAQPHGAWWQAFGDPQLNALQARVGDTNQSLKAAFARLEQARAETRVSRADLFPTLDAKAAATRERVSPNAPRFPVGAKPLLNDFSVGAELSYEVDLWGRIRNQVKSAKADQQASAADLAALDLSIRAELAMDYFSLRSADRQAAILDKAVGDYATSLELTQHLFDGGAAPLADVAQAAAQLGNARTQAADVRLRRSQVEHSIALLLGENPTVFHLDVAPLSPDVAPPPIDPGLPSVLLERRPDIAEAERRVASANAQIGVARAAYFPQFSLSGTGGFESTSTTNWLAAPSRFWSIGPQLTLPLFEGGRLTAQVDKSKAVYAERVANYRNTVLAGYRDVEDNLAALRQLAVESGTNGEAVAATRTALEQAQYRYDAGIVTFLEVAAAETAALQAQLTATDLQTRRLTAGVLLIKALGGGWRTDGSG